MAQYKTVNEYLTRIKETYTKAREEYTALHDRLEILQAQWEREQARGWKDMEEAKADKERYTGGINDYKGKIETLINNTNAEYEKIKAECDEVFAIHSRPTGDKIDQGTIELLKSGTLKGVDFKPLAEDFKDNVAMSRIIGQYAIEKGEKENNPELRGLGAALKSATIPYKEHIDRMIYNSQCGMRADRGKSDAVHKYYDKWTDEIFADAEGISVKVSD